MSITKVPRNHGHAWKVRWYEESGRQRTKSFTRKEDAETFEAKVTLAKRRGDLAELDAGRVLLKTFVPQWRTLHVEQRLAPATQKAYADIVDRILLPRLGHLQLRRITPKVVSEMAAGLSAVGMGGPMLRKTLAVLQGIMRAAVLQGRITANPVPAVKKPPQRRKRVVTPVSPTEVERMRSDLLRAGRVRDATLISVLAYAGLRPQEAMALTWGDIGAQTIQVDKALSFGEVKETKTRRDRTVRLLTPLVVDLNEWRSQTAGDTSSPSLVFPKKSGGAWSDPDYRNWRSRIYTPAAKAAGVQDSTRPYSLRHSFASLLFQEGRNPAEIAEQMGHSLQTLIDTYTHVLEELRGQPAQSAEALIYQARP